MNEPDENNSVSQSLRDSTPEEKKLWLYRNKNDCFDFNFGEEDEGELPQSRIESCM